MKNLTTEQLEQILGGTENAKVKLLPNMEDGRKVWVLTKPAIRRLNAGYPTDPRW